MVCVPRCRAVHLSLPLTTTLPLAARSIEDMDWQLKRAPGQPPPDGRPIEPIGYVSCAKFTDAAALGYAPAATGHGGDWVVVVGSGRAVAVDLGAMQLVDLRFPPPAASDSFFGPKTLSSVAVSGCEVLGGGGPGGGPVLAFSRGTTVYLMEPGSWRLLAELESPESRKELVQLAGCELPEGNKHWLLATGSEDGLLLLWDLAHQDGPAKVARAHAGSIGSISYSKSAGQLVTVGAADLVIRIWRLPAVEQQWEVKLAGAAVSAAHCRQAGLAQDALWLFRPGREPAIWCMRGQSMENQVRESDTAFPCTSAAIKSKTGDFACGAAGGRDRAGRRARRCNRLAPRWSTREGGSGPGSSCGTSGCGRPACPPAAAAHRGGAHDGWDGGAAHRCPPATPNQHTSLGVSYTSWCANFEFRGMQVRRPSRGSQSYRGRCSRDSPPSTDALLPPAEAAAGVGVVPAARRASSGSRAVRRRGVAG